MGGRDSRPSKNDLPRRTTTFIGREHDASELKELIADSPLVTVTGPGGTGKTRLAVEVGADAAEGFADGIHFVGLASISDANAVAGRVLDVLEIRPDSSDPCDDIVDALRERDLMLILDNCEHVVEGCADLADRIVGECPDVRIVATSREPLRVHGERDFRLRPLSLPRDGAPIDEIGEIAAVKLFCDRAARVRRGFVLDESNATAVARICALLDGMPLAIELAAARAGVMSIADIAANLAGEISFLVSRERTNEPRQRTLEACIAWSHNLLTDTERLAFRRISVFTSTFTAEDAQRIIGLELQPTRDVLVSLVDRSLLDVVGNDDETRYRMLVTIRAFASRRAEEEGESEELRAAHFDHVRAAVAVAQPQLEGPERSHWFSRLELLHDDVRASLQWGHDHDREDAVEMTLEMLEFWVRRGHLAEAQKWLELAERTRTMRSRVVEALGTVAEQSGDRDAARGWYEEAVALTRAAGDLKGEALALRQLGQLSRDEGRYEDARDTLRACAEVAAAIPDARLELDADYLLGTVDLFQSHLDAAADCFERVIMRARSLEMHGRVVAVLHSLGQLEKDRGNLSRATELVQEAMLSSEQDGDKPNIAVSKAVLADVYLLQGRLEDARRLGSETLELARELDAAELVHAGLGLLAGVAAHSGELYRARDLWLEASEIARRMRARNDYAIDIGQFGSILAAMGRSDEARSQLEEAVQILTEAGDGVRAAEHLGMMAQLALGLGRSGEAQDYLAEAHRIGGRDDELLVAELAGPEAELLRHRGSLEEATSRLEDALAFARRSGFDPFRADVLRALARVAIDRGRNEVARSNLDEALETLRTIGSIWRSAPLLELGAELAVHGGAYERAARLLGCAERLRETSGLVPSMTEADAIRAVEAAVAAAAGRRALESAWAQGRGMSAARAIDYALHTEDPDVAGAASNGAPVGRRVPQPEVPAGGTSIALEGEYWTVSSGSSTVRIKDAKGMRYLAHLIAGAGREFHVFELVAAVEGRTPSGRLAPTEDIGATTASGLEVLDEQAREAYRSRLEDLRLDLEEAEAWGDIERASRAKEEMDALTEQLAAAVGLGGRSRQASSDSERARWAVSKALRTVVRRISEAMPDLGKQLERGLNTGTFCSFEPDPLRPLQASW